MSGISCPPMFPLPWHCLFSEGTSSTIFSLMVPLVSLLQPLKLKVHLTSSSQASTISSFLHSCLGLATYWRMCKCCVTYLHSTVPRRTLHLHGGERIEWIRKCRVLTIIITVLLPADGNISPVGINCPLQSRPSDRWADGLPGLRSSMGISEGVFEIRYKSLIIDFKSLLMLWNVFCKWWSNYKSKVCCSSCISIRRDIPRVVLLVFKCLSCMCLPNKKIKFLQLCLVHCTLHELSNTTMLFLS